MAWGQGASEAVRTHKKVDHAAMQRLRIETDTHLAAEVTMHNETLKQHEVAKFQDKVLPPPLPATAIQSGRSSEDAAVDAAEARQAALNSRREKLKQVLDTEAAEAMQGFKERGLALMK